MHSPSPTEVYALPGTLCDQRLWSKLSLDFPLEHIAIPKQNSITDMLTALEQRLPQKKVKLLGFSLGGYIAAAFCARFPHRVQQLCALSNAPAPLPEAESQQRTQLLAWVAKHGYSGISRQKIAQLLHPKNIDRTDLYQQMRAMDATFGEAGLIHQLKSSRDRRNILPELAKLSIPLLFIHGSDDPLVDPALLNSLVAMTPHAHTTIIPECGHMLPLEAPERLSCCLNAWFNHQTLEE